MHRHFVGVVLLESLKGFLESGETTEACSATLVLCFAGALEDQLPR